MNELLYTIILNARLLHTCLLVFAISIGSIAAQDCYKIDRSRHEWTDSVAVSVGHSKMIQGVSIRQATPNPFGNAINIEYELPHPDNALVTIIDLYGRKIKTLAGKFHDAGRYNVQWDGKSDGGTSQPPGLYIIRLETSQMLESAKIILSK